MAVKRNSDFSKKELLLADFAKALSHPARIKILQILAKKDSCICGEIVEVLPLSQSTVSQHLKALKEAGLIKGTIEGVRSCYCIDKKMVNKCLRIFDTYFGNIKKCC